MKLTRERFNVLVADQMSEEGLRPLLNSETVHVTKATLENAGDLSIYDALIIRSATTVTKKGA